jgi:integrase
MASLYKRDRSPFWWIEYIDAAGERRQESTKLRCDTTAHCRQARQLRNDLTTRELAARTTGFQSSGSEPDGRSEMWAAWVPRFILQRYATSQPTRIRYEQAWRNIDAYLRSEMITVPRQLTRQQIRDFIQWRQQSHRELGVRKAKKNTALLEVKFLGIVMAEAVESGFCRSNPCLRLGIGRDEPKQKPKITVEEHRFITRMLKREPEWMRVAYRIAWEQGCRISETHLNLLHDVDLASNVLRLRTKGQKERVAEVPLSPRLRPLLRRLILEQREFTYEMPKAAPKKFWIFFRKIGLPHLSFHSTRVTFITRCYEEARLSEQDAMRLALHASTTVHRIYPRLPAQSAHLQDAMRRVAKSAAA